MVVLVRGKLTNLLYIQNELMTWDRQYWQLTVKVKWQTGFVIDTKSINSGTW